MRDAILTLAAQAPDAIIPAYTWGVQAQPITLGHYLSGYAAAFDREATRMREAYARLNQSPLGAAASGHVEFPGRPAEACGIARLRRAAGKFLRRQPDLADR